MPACPAVLSRIRFTRFISQDNQRMARRIPNRKPASTNHGQRRLGCPLLLLTLFIRQLSDRA